MALLTKPQGVLDDYLTPGQLATELDVCEKTLERWRAAGQGPPFTKLGRAILYRRPSVAKWLEARESL